MIRYILFLTFIASMTSCAEKSATKTTEEKETKTKITLEKKWETDTVYTTAESAIYDEERDIIYVSNIENNPWGADGQGSIGQLSATGDVVNERWITGLNAPKGMGIVGNYLYVTDLKSLVEIDVTSGKINKEYEVEEAGGLNDITTSPDGTVYISDSQKGLIFKLEDNQITMIKDSLASSNGIFYDDDKLIVGTWEDEKVSSMSLKDSNMKPLSNNITQPDGIEADGMGGYFVSSWKGLVHYIHPDGSSEIILDSTADEIGAADLDYIPSKNLLLVPTFFHNTIAAYEVKRE